MANAEHLKNGYSNSTTPEVHNGVNTNMNSILANEIEPFSFEAVFDANPGQLIVSRPIIVSEPPPAVSVWIRGGEYSINNGEFTSEPGIAYKGDKIRARVRSSSEFTEKVTASLYLNQTAKNFSVQTKDLHYTNCGNNVITEGTIENQSITICLSIMQRDRDKTQSVYIVGVTQDYQKSSQSIFALTSNGWVNTDLSNLTAYHTGKIGNRLEKKIIHNEDLSKLIGTELYIGYGQSAQDMLDSGTFKRVYTVYDRRSGIPTVIWIPPNQPSKNP